MRPEGVDGEGWTRVRPTEWNGYHLAVQFADNEELQPKVRALHAIHRGPGGVERPELSSFTFGEGTTNEIVSMIAGHLLPEFLYLCLVIQIPGFGDEPPTNAYAVVVWQAGSPFPRVVICRDLRTGERFELRSNTLCKEGTGLPKIPAWPSRRPEIRDLTEGEALDAAALALADTRANGWRRGWFAFGITARVFQSWAELLLGGAGLTTADLPEPPKEAGPDGGVLSSRLMPDAGPDNLPELLARGYDAILMLVEGSAFVGGDASHGDVLAKALCNGIELDEVVGVKRIGVGLAAALFLRDVENIGPVPGMRLLRSWTLEPGGWEEAQADVFVRRPGDGPPAGDA